MNDYGYYGSAAESSGMTMGAVNRIGAVAPPTPTSGYPTSGDSRQQAVNNPAQVRQDAANLRLLDYPAPDTGNAYDPKFREAVTLFQRKMGTDLVGPIDGLIGPQTRSVLVDVVRALNGGNSNGGQAPIPGGGGGSLSNTVAGDGDSLMTYLPYGLAAAAAIGLGYFLLKR